MKRKQDLWVGKFDYSDPERVKRMFRETFDEQRKLFLEYVGMSPNKDLDRVRYTKRMETSLKNLQYAREMIGDDYPDYPGVTYFERDWAYINAFNNDSYDAIDQQYDLILAAAVWILDTLNEDYYAFELEQKFLPELTEEEAENIPSWLIAYDSTFSESMLLKTVYVLLHRNDDCNVYTPKNERQRNILDEATVRDRHHQEVPSRRWFEAILSALNPERIEEAVNEFKEKYWALARCFFAGLRENHEKRDSLLKSHDRLEMKLSSYMDDRRRVGFMFSEDGSINSTEKLKTTLELQRAIARCHDAVSDGVHEKEDYVGLFPEALSMSEAQRKDLMSEEFNERFRSFRIENPYRLAFALLYLADRGDDLIWMYYFGTALAKMIADTLPWRYYAESELVENLEEQYEDCAGNPLPDIYALNYGNDDYEHYRERRNMAQMIYELTGVIMPRDYDAFSWAANYWDEYDVNEEDQKLMRFGVGIMDALHFRNEDRYKQPDSQTETKTDPAMDSGKDINETIQKLEARIRALTNENKELKEASWNAHSQNAKLSEKLEKAYSDAHHDREELAKLREIVFLSQNPQSEAPDQTIPLPYETEQRIVICGGHDSFLRQFSQLITGNIRYLNNVRVNEDLIRNADRIWIQTNAISHSEYYKVVDLCRKNNRPLNYFLYASARKCAEQVVQDCLKQKNQIR